MRRLEQDERREYENLLALTRPQRLFVQRWMELFDRDTILNFRCRPFSREKVIAARPSHGVADYHVDVMDDELAATPDIALADVKLTELAAQPVRVAESLAQATSAAGFDHRFLFHAYKAMLYPPRCGF